MPISHQPTLFDSALSDQEISILDWREHESIHFHKGITSISTTEIYSSDIEHDAPKTDTILDDTIQRTFKAFETQWIDDPVITQWRNPNHRIHDVMEKVNELYHAWTPTEDSERPFSPFSDPLWLETGRVLAEVGLPWHNNQVSMPYEIDTSWPFHFKSYEGQVIREKGARVGDADASGYISNYNEANCYCIRAIQQELRGKISKRPILVYDNFDEKISHSAAKFFGLQTYRISLLEDPEAVIEELYQITDGLERPVIFAATLAAADGSYDNLDIICDISKFIPLLLHVDATRNFDYITTLSEKDNKRLGIQGLKMKLTIKPLQDTLRLRDGSISVTSIAAGGANYTDPAPVVALKPASLGESQNVNVSYIKASDSTLCGSRDAIAPLWVALQEIRFGESGLRAIYQRCAHMRTLLLAALESARVTTAVVAPPYSLDVILKSCSQEQIEGLISAGGVKTTTGDVVITIQPGVKLEDIDLIVSTLCENTSLQSILSASNIPFPAIKKLSRAIQSQMDFSQRYKIPRSIVHELITTVDSWRTLTRTAAGYPLNMSSYSALGPVIGRFLDIDIPKEWLIARSEEIMTSRMVGFGLRNEGDRSDFKGTFTNGSTMGNRIGIHAALSRLPYAFVYFSAESHYSVMKSMRDCDDIMNRWSSSTVEPRYSQIPSDADGRMSVQLLVEKALRDREECRRRGEEYYMILFLNMGTTFVGARDDIKEVHTVLKEAGIEISHIHVDGALDFGFDNCGVKLGSPGMLDSQGTPLVQGVTFSHHKAMGGMVSGEVICYSPGERLPLLDWNVDPKIIFETWLYGQAYTATDTANLLRYCQNNSAYLEDRLQQIGVATKRNTGHNSITVVLEKLPAWIAEEFALRPQGDWMHILLMPHISRETIDLFISKISEAKRHCTCAFSYVNPLLDNIMRHPVRLQLLRSVDPLARRVIRNFMTAKALFNRSDEEPEDAVTNGIHSALSVAMLGNDNDRLETVLILESTNDRTIRVGPLLVNSRHVKNRRMISDVARQLAGYMARQMNAPLEIDSLSYGIYITE